MQLKTKLGLGLLALGMAVFAGWDLWVKTRKFVPVDLPVSLAAGQTITSEFKLNFDGLYLIEIDAEKTLPLDTLHCVMGVEGDAAKCKDIPPAIGTDWILSSNGQEVSHGSSLESHSAPVQSDGVARVIGEFQGKAGLAYKLQATFTADGRSLAAAHPRLKVGVSSIAYTDIQSAGVLVFSTAFICALFGLVLLSIACFARQKSGSAGASESA
ncbi:MAG: hypothetical protein WBL63_18985 [Candidatus Acidiferrum sp.]